MTSFHLEAEMPNKLAASSPKARAAALRLRAQALPATRPDRPSLYVAGSLAEWAYNTAWQSVQMRTWQQLSRSAANSQRPRHAADCQAARVGSPGLDLAPASASQRPML